MPTSVPGEASDRSSGRRMQQSRLWRTVAALSRWFGRLGARRSARLERTLLLIAALVFGVGGYVAYRALPDLESQVRWVPLVLAAVLGAPATVLANAAEYRVSAHLLRHRVAPSEAIRVSLLASAANLLPMPGSPLVRMRALRQLGSSYRGAFSSTALVGLTWIGMTGVLVGGFSVPAGRLAFGTILLGVGVVATGVAYGALRMRRPGEEWILIWPLLVVEAVSVLVVGARFFLVLQGLGIDASFSQAIALTGAGVIASVVGFFPGGLGIRELLAAGIGPAVGLSAAAGLLAAAIDRLVQLVVLTPASLASFLVAGRLDRRAGEGPGAEERTAPVPGEATEEPGSPQ